MRGLTIGMVIGDTSQMDERQVRDMRVAGLAHLTAVSGAHFAAIALALGFALRALRWRRWARALVLCVAMAAFVALVFPGPSVVRAAWMGAAVAAALAWGRPPQALPALASAVIGLLLLDPYLALSYGFALSVLATAAIALWAPILAVHLARVFTPLFARVLAVPLAAQVACAPVIVLLNPGLGPYAVPANLVALPCAAVTTIVGLAAVLASAISPALGTVGAFAASLPAWPVAWSARAFAGVPGAWLPWPSGPGGALLAAACSGAFVAATTARRVAGWARVAGALVVLGVVGASPPVRATIAAATWSAPDDWRVAVCDVGQGDAVLLRAGADSAVMIDVGPPGGEGLACLRAHGIRSVPLLVLTHPHADHDGAIREVLDAVPVTGAWVSNVAWDGSRDRAVRALQGAGIPVATPRAGTVVTAGDVRLAVWRTGAATARTSSDVNDASLVTWGDAGGVSFVELGDLESSGQAALIRAAVLPAGSDVVKVAHHGSASQDPRLAARIGARAAAVSVGSGNPYGHPADATIASYAAAGSRVFRTDQCGELDVRPGGNVEASTPMCLARGRLGSWSNGADAGCSRRAGIGRRPLRSFSSSARRACSPIGRSPR